MATIIHADGTAATLSPALDVFTDAELRAAIGGDYVATPVLPKVSIISATSGPVNTAIRDIYGITNALGTCVIAERVPGVDVDSYR